MGNEIPLRREGLRTFASRALKAVLRGTVLPKMRRHAMSMRFVSAAVCGLIRLCFPICRNRIVFASFSGDCSCNPMSIADALIRKRPDLDIVWWVDPYTMRRRRRGLENRRIGRLVEQWTLRGLMTVLTARVQIENAQTFESRGMPEKRKGQFRLNTWHGSLGIKRLDTAGRKFDERCVRLRRETDAVLVNSTFEDRVFEESLFPGTRRLRFGHPRNDALFLPAAEREERRQRIMQELGLDASEKLALYAPTFRAEGFFAATATYDFATWSQSLAERFGGRWRVAIRLHPTDRRILQDGLAKLPRDVMNVSEFEDLSRLLVAVDAGVTDYSSWIFDFLLTGRPGFILAPDREHYAASRGLYYPIESTPFPVATDERGLLENVRSFDTERYARSTRTFLKDRGCFEHGDAAVRTADEIVCILNQDSVR